MDSGRPRAPGGDFLRDHGGCPTARLLTNAKSEPYPPAGGVRSQNAEKRIHAPASTEGHLTRNQVLTCLIEIAGVSEHRYTSPLSSMNSLRNAYLTPRAGRSPESRSNHASWRCFCWDNQPLEKMARNPSITCLRILLFVVALTEKRHHTAEMENRNFKCDGVDASTSQST